MGSADCHHAGERRDTVRHGTPVLTAVFRFGQADAVLFEWQCLSLRWPPHFYVWRNG